MRRNLNKSVSGRRICGTPATGIRGALIPSTGDHGAAYAYKSLDLPADNDLEICGEILTWPSAGRLFAYEDTSFEFSDAPDGTYYFTWRLKVFGVVIGDPVTVTLQVGPAVHAATGALSSDNAGVIGAANRTHVHDVTGALSASQSVVDGSVERVVSYTVHSSSGALLASGAQVLGAAARSGSTLIHVANAVLSASAAQIVASASRSGSAQPAFTEEQLAYILTYVQEHLMVPTTDQIATAVVAALQQTAIPVAPVDVVSVKGDTSIAPWPTAEQNANTVLNGVTF